MNILTFDIEDWFHQLEHKSTQTEKDWANYEVRIHKNTERILHILEETQRSATFFVLGWIAEKYPEVVRSIVDKGYELGSHTHYHQLVYQQTPKTFKNDVEKSIKTIEDISGQKIKYFRAPGFSITQDSLWSLEVLHELGIEIDCSIFPANRAHGGLSIFGQDKPAIIQYNDIELKELPINYTKVLRKPIVFSGGGYFRFFPYQLLSYWTKKSDYVMSYIHPRDLDATQPMIEDLPSLRQFKFKVGLRHAEQKFKKWLTEFDFIDIKTANTLINWQQLPTIQFDNLQKAMAYVQR